MMRCTWRHIWCEHVVVRHCNVQYVYVLQLFFSILWNNWIVVTMVCYACCICTFAKILYITCLTSISLQNQSFPPDRSFGFLPSNSFQPMSDALYELQVHSVSSVYAFMYMCAYLVKFKMLSGTGTGAVRTYIRMYSTCI